MAIKPKNVDLTANSVEILNQIREGSSAAYQRAIPKAAGNTESIRKIGGIMMDYEPLQNEFLSALYNRIGRVIISSKMYWNPWAPFKKGLMELGETVEEVFVNIAKAHTFNPQVAETKWMERQIPDVRAAFHTMNYQKFYKATIWFRVWVRRRNWGTLPPIVPIIRTGHTEMAFDSNHTMGAHSSRVPLDQQVSINSNPSKSTDWLELWRYGTGAQSEWIKGNYWLSMGEMQNNALIIFRYLLARGWTVEAISGMLGNMQVESHINPGVWQDLNPNPKLGWGLVQWTPSTNFTDWASAHGYANDDGDAQLLWIDTETVNYGQWIPTAQYPESFNQFKVSTQTPEYLADCFLKNFERPGDINQPIRQTYARYWYDWWEGSPVPPPNPNPEPDWKPSMPIWFALRKF